MPDNKALFEDVRMNWQVTLTDFISQVSNYTGLQSTALAAYIFSISTNECLKCFHLQSIILFTVYVRVLFNMQR